MPQVWLWVAAVLGAVVIGLVTFIFMSNIKEVERLRDWKHDVADPAIRAVGFLKEQYDDLKRWRERHEEREQQREQQRGPGPQRK